MTDPQDGAERPEASRSDRSLVRELYRRGVVQAGVAHLVIGWLLIQIADVTADKIGLPEWTTAFVTFTVIGGFPLTLILAWVLEYTEGKFRIDEGDQAGSVIIGLGRNYLAIIGAYAIAAVGVLIYQYTIGFDEAKTLPETSPKLAGELVPVEPNSIAVLRFRNIDGSDTSQIFAEGLAEDLLDRLAKIPGLLVSSRPDAWSLPDNAPSKDVRQRLRVAYFVVGSVQLDGSSLRSIVRLIDSRTGFQIDSRTFDRTLENVLELQHEITSLITANLRIALPGDTIAGIVPNFDSDNVDAYVLYRRGRELLNQPQTGESMQRVIDFYLDALAVDPDYAAAHAGICSASVELHRLTLDANNIATAEEACDSALQANPNLHMVYTALGDLYLETGRNEAAERAYQQALKINAQDVAAMHGLARVYEVQLRLDEAEALLHNTIRLQPGNWRSIDSLGWFLFANGRYNEAAEAYEQVTNIDPRNWQGHGNRGSALLMAGDFEEAASALRRALEFESDAAYQSSLGIIYYYLGEFDDAVAIHLEVVEALPDSNIDWLNLGDAMSFSSSPGEAAAAYRAAAQLSEAQLEVNSRDARTLYRLAWAMANLDDIEYARELIDQSRSIDPGNPYVYYYSALINVRQSDYESAVGDLVRAVDVGYPVNMLKAEPLLDDLRENPGFVSLIGD